MMFVLALGSGIARAWTDAGDRAMQEANGAPVVTESPAAAPQEVRRVSLHIKGTNSREWSRYGFSDDELVAVITARLTSTGIDVVATARDVPVLEIDVHVNDQIFNNSYIVYIRLKDRLALPQNPEGFVTRTVWSDWKLGAFEPYNYRKLRAAILELVDVFASQRLLSR